MTGNVRRQARGAQRRAQLLDATIHLIAARGTHAVTHRAVAEAAGTSLRATTYYFASKDELLEEAFCRYADQAGARFDALVAALGHARLDPDTAADLLVETVMGDLEEDRLGLVAEYELVLEITRNPALEAAYTRWQGQLEALLVTAASRLGSPTPDLHARIVLAVVRGLEIEALARPRRKIDRDGLRQVFVTLLAGLLGAKMLL